MEYFLHSRFAKYFCLFFIIGARLLEAQTTQTTTPITVEKYDLTSFNVGYGVVIIAIGMIFSAVLCILGRGTRFPE